MSAGLPPPPPPPSGPGGPTYPPPPGAMPPYGAPPPGKPRPRPRSWVAAVLLVGVGIAVGVLLIARTVLAFTDVDTTVEADDQPHSVSVPTDEDRMVWQREGQQAACDIVDLETGQSVATESLGASFTKSGGSGSWVGAYRFDAGSGDLEVTCAASGGDVQIAPAAEFGSFFGGLALGILLPLVLVGGGVVWLIVLTVLTVTRRKAA